MKNDANIRNFIEISRNLHGKSGKMQGKSGNFRGIHSSKWQNRREILRSFPVVSGRFRSFFRSFLVMIPIDSAKSFRFIPNDSFSFLFFPFHSTSFHFHSSNPQFLCSTTYFQQIFQKFLRFLLLVPIILRTFAIDYKIVVIYSAMATVSPRLHAVGFFYAYKVSFSRQREKGLFNMAVA